MATIKQTYHDALFFASASINKSKDFYLTSSDYKVLTKLIHQSTLYSEVTIQNDTIAKYVWLAETTVRDSIKSLLRMNYIETKSQVFNNRGGFKSIRTISINWDRLETILTKSKPIELQEEQTTSTDTCAENTPTIIDDYKANEREHVDYISKIPSSNGTDEFEIPKWKIFEEYQKPDWCRVNQ